jgi:hypothetical protein
LLIWTFETQVMAKRMAVWLSTTKSRELTRFTYLQMTCDIQLESSRQELQLCFRSHSIKGLLTKLWGSKVAGVPTSAISGLPPRSPDTKNHLDVGSVASHIVYYKGGRWWLPPSPGRGESCVSVLPVVSPNTKSDPIMH